MNNLSIILTWDKPKNAQDILEGPYKPENFKDEETCRKWTESLAKEIRPKETAPLAKASFAITLVGKARVEDLPEWYLSCDGKLYW